MSFKKRLVNVFAGLMNLSFVVVVMSLFVLPLAWNHDFNDSHVFLVIFVCILIAIIAVINYLAFGSLRLWNRLSDE